MWKRNLLLLAAVAGLAVAPLAYHGTDAAFTGSDGQAETLINQAHPDYQPWVTPLWEPPSSEIESLLFALQAALGAGLLGYYFGRRRGIAEARGDAADRATRRS
ncbi:energy-coupling factor ABC transporter substrate-binding protein [Dongia sp.]|uniref:energy-coupling factor ABC transporter substrate-binding protein n=1 Tax=Dongia sp. TaxID=1977262 RepID=UPI0035B2022E